MNLSAINLGIWVLFGVLAAVCVLKGLLKGFFLSVLRTAKNLLAALLAVPLTQALSGKMTPMIVELLLPLAEKAGFDVGNDAPNLTVAVEDLMAAVASLLLYIGVFLLLLLIFWIVVLIIGGIFKGIEKATLKKNGLSRLLGAALGLFSGVIMFCALTLPIVGLSHTVNTATDTLLTSEREIEFVEENRETLETANDATDFVVNHALVKPLWATAQKGMYRSVASTKTEYGRAVLDDEIQAAVNISCDVFTLTEVKISEFSDPQVQAIMHIAEQIKDTRLIPELLSGFLSDACTAWLKGEDFLGIAKPEVDPPADLLVDSVFLMFSTANAENIGEDLIVFADMIGTMNDYQVFTAFENTDDLINLLADGEMVTELLDTLTSNEHTEVIVEGLVDMATGVLTQELGIAEEDTQAVFDLMDNVATSLNDTLETGTEEERVEAVNEQLTGFAEQFNLGVTEEDLTSVAETLVEVLGTEEINMESAGSMYSSIISAFLQSDLLDSLNLGGLPE